MAVPARDNPLRLLCEFRNRERTMKPATLIAVTAALCITLFTATVWFFSRTTPTPSGPPPLALAPTEIAPTPSPAAVEEPVVHTATPAPVKPDRPLEPAPQSAPEKAPAPQPTPARPAAQPTPPFDPGEPIIPKPVARLALSFVGADPDAEDLWAIAINDPNLPPNTRKDLIEDLNEDGFPDPKHITFDDLPLILSRLQLIEDLAPEAFDDINAAAFGEAYKDLVNMLAKLSRQ